MKKGHNYRLYFISFYLISNIFIYHVKKFCEVLPLGQVDENFCLITDQQKSISSVESEIFALSADAASLTASIHNQPSLVCHILNITICRSEFKLYLSIFQAYN